MHGSMLITPAVDSFQALRLYKLSILVFSVLLVEVLERWIPNGMLFSIAHITLRLVAGFD